MKVVEEERKGEPNLSKDVPNLKEGVGLRRSSRERSAPKKLTYPTLGNPLVTVMHSILSGLDQAFTQASPSTVYPA